MLQPYPVLTGTEPLGDQWWKVMLNGLKSIRNIHLSFQEGKTFKNINVNL